MKRLQLLSILFVGLLFAGCGGLKKMKKEAANVKYTVTPSPLELHAGEVEVTIKGKVPPKYFHKKVIVEATPVLKWDGGEKAYSVKKLQGESVQANNQVINNADGGSFSYTAKIPYQEGMDVSELEVRLKGYIPGKEDKAIEFEPVKVADGVISTANLVQLDGQTVIAKDKFQRIIPETKYAEILYTIQQSNVRGSQKKSEQMKALKAYIKEVKANERKAFKGVKISSYASPDGNLDINAPLSEKRGKSAQKYIKREFKKTEEAKQEGFVSYESTAEDWEGFKELVQASDLQDKNLILRVLSMYSDPAQREKEIKNISATYVTLAKEILPKLRRSKINVNVDLIGYSDEELKNIYAQKADDLKKEELLYTATLFSDIDKKIEVYERAQAIYPKCWRGFNNAGIFYIQKGNLDKAKSNLEKAKVLSSGNAIVMNNLAVVAIRKGNIEVAKELLTSANGAGNAVNYNKGIVAIKQGDYASAVSTFGSEAGVNVAIAKLLNGDNAGALRAINASNDKEKAMGYYVKAIVAARNGEASNVFTNLTNAVKKDSKLRNKAKTNMEFAKYFANDTFKSIVE